jgi:hypothetical protein
VRIAAALLTLAGLATALSGCGGEGEDPAALRLQREDLILVSSALQRIAPSVALEVAAAKTAWPLVSHGLAARGGAAIAGVRASVQSARRASSAIVLPAALREGEASALTGPAAAIAGQVRSFLSLCSRGWELIDAGLAQIEAGPPANASFARANLPLYIESVYDGHFTLAQVGRQLAAGYSKLGGGQAFGSALAPAQVQALAGGYSEARDRLHPHVSVRLGS